MSDDREDRPGPSLSEARDDLEREAAKQRVLAKLREKKMQRGEHVFLGKGILDVLAHSGQRLMYTDDSRCWLYERGLWTGMTPDEEKRFLSVHVERGCRLAGVTSTSKIVNETREWLRRNPDIDKKGVPWDAHGMIATTGGMIDWRTGGEGDRAITPEDYCTSLIDCANDLNAGCPIWDRVLKEDYQLDDGTIDFLQESLGVALIQNKPRTLMRALVLLGPSNTGKSNILDVMAGVISGKQNSTELKTIENAHGTVAFLEPIPWVLHEAFDQSRWEMSATVKALLSGDPIRVNIKNGPLVQLVFRQPVFWGSNVPPQFKESSKAMENRLAIVKMDRVFDPLRIEGTMLEAQRAGCNKVSDYVLKKEKAGVLNWAIVGLRRAMERGHFEFTNQMRQSLHQMRTDSNVALGFIEACCSYSPDHYINAADFYGAFRVWHGDHRGQQVPTVDSVGRAMRALADPCVLVGEHINRVRVYAGIKLNDEGLDCWNAYSASQWAVQSGQRISGSAGEVNRTLTQQQLTKPSFLDMRSAHGRTRPQLVAASG